ncbi:MAG TPA: galactokinase family protein [Thermodesulfobacteriota bacterium]|nr:galactokinase family protein [Thermodesulfobacteriota bacterium]
MRFAPLDKQTEETLAYLKRRESLGDSRSGTVVSPYRISPLGAHIDHQGGPVLGMTIDARSVLAFFPNDERRVRLYSMNYPGVTEFDIDNIKTPGRDDWGRYAMGAAKVLDEYRGIKRGFTGAISGALPSAGLSSSASSGLAYLRALASLNDHELGPEEYVELDRRIENDYLKLSNGILDQSSIVFGKRESLLYIDTVTGHTASYPRPKNWDDFRILIVYSGIPRDLTSSGFNTRVEECRKAAGLLGIMGGLRSAKTLSYIPEKVFQEKSSKLPEDLRRRAEHFFSESERVTMGVAAWNRGDIKLFGHLMNESCRSSFVNYEVGSPELVALQEIIASTDGVYGSRLNGGGYGGSVTAFVRKDFSEDQAPHILESYRKQFPGPGADAGAYFAQSDDGLRLL